MATFEINKHILKDGQIVIYQRSDHADPKWQARISIPGSPKFRRLSLKTRNLDDAKRTAADTWDKLYNKVQNGGTINSKTYKAVALEFLKDLGFRADTKEVSKAKTLSDRLIPYSVKFFASAKVDEIGKKEIAAYAEWRLKNGLRKVPSNNTLRAERSAMLRVFKWAQDKGYLAVLPHVPQPKGKDNRRPDFTRTEIDVLFNAMEIFIRTNKNGRTHRDRQMLCNYVRFMTFAGLRVGEARRLTWKDIEERTIDGVDCFVLRVSGKTGFREMIPQPPASAVLAEMKIARTAECNGVLELDEPVFRNRKGGQVTSFKNGFQALVEFAQLDEGTTAKRRVIYSLRHSYATQMMAWSTNLFYLAHNMGTSVEMLERFYGHVASEDLAKALSKSEFGRVTRNSTVAPETETKANSEKQPVGKPQLRLVSSR